MLLKTTLNDIKSETFFSYYENIMWDKKRPQNIKELNVIDSLAYISYVDNRIKEAKESLLYMINHYTKTNIEFRIEIHNHFDYIKRIEVIIP